MSDQRNTLNDRPAVDVSLLIIRVAVGTIFFAHGAQKMWGWYGGDGLAATVDKMGLGPLGYLVAIGEFFGGCGLVVGFLARFSAASITLIMCGAIAMVHGQNGFFMSDGGFEYNIALIGLALPIVLMGPGKFAIGRFLPLPKAKGSDRPVLPLE